MTTLIGNTLFMVVFGIIAIAAVIAIFFWGAYHQAVMLFASLVMIRILYLDNKNLPRNGRS